MEAGEVRQRIGRKLSIVIDTSGNNETKRIQRRASSSAGDAADQLNSSLEPRHGGASHQPSGTPLGSRPSSPGQRSQLSRTYSLKQSTAAKLKTLQNTPYPMVIARIKTLLSRLSLLLAPPWERQQSSRLGSRPGSPEQPQVWQASSRPSTPPTEAMARRSSNCSSLEGQSRTESQGSGFRRSATMLQRQQSQPPTPGSPSKAATLGALQELSFVLSFVSSFLAQLPEAQRQQVCRSARMEHFKKDQQIFSVGDVADRMAVILTGTVEVWTHPPGNRRAKTVLQSLKRGDTFGGREILNQEVHSHVVTAASNCTLLSVSQADFCRALTPYFRDKQEQVLGFLRQHVAPLQDVPLALLRDMAAHTTSTTFPAGHTWAPATDPQVHFVVSGACRLLQRLEPPDSSVAAVLAAAAAAAAAGGDDGDGSPPLFLGQSGTLASVQLVAGRPVGTLGRQEEIRRQMEEQAPKKVLADMEAGHWFGGGPDIYGQGAVQGALLVVAREPLEVLHIHIDDLLQHGGLELVRALREDCSFQMTYQCARVGLLGLGGAVGHADSTLLDGSSSRRKQPRKARIANQRLCQQPTDMPSPSNTRRSSNHSTRRQSTASDVQGTSRPGSPSHSRPGSPNGRQTASLQQTPRPGSPAARPKVQRSLSMASSVAMQHTAAVSELARSPSLRSSGVQRDSEAEGDTGRASATGDTVCAGGADGSMTHRSSVSSVSGRSCPAARRAGSPRHRVLALQRSGASSRAGSRPATAPAKAGMLTSSAGPGASAGDGAVQVWQADDDYSFLNDPSLTPEEQEIMLQHMQGGRKKGLLTGLGYQHVPGSGVFSPTVQEALAKVAELKAEHQQAGSSSTAARPAAEAYWSDPATSSTHTAAQLAPLLGSIYTDGVAPLASRLKQLRLMPGHGPVAGPGAAATGGLGSRQPSTAAGTGAADLTAVLQQVAASRSALRPGSGKGAPSGGAGGVVQQVQGPAQAPGTARYQTLRVEVGGQVVAVPGPAAGAVQHGKAGHAGGQGARPQTAPARQQHERVLQQGVLSSRALQLSGGHLAAAVLWERAAGKKVPELRQCLTYDEIVGRRR